VSEADVRAMANRIHRSPRVVTLSAQTLDMVFEDIMTVAGALDRRTRGEELLASLRERMKRVHNVLSLSQAPRPRVVVLEWTDPPFVAGHWVPEMVHRAGGVDVFAVPGQHSRQVLWDSIVDAAPAIVVVAPCGYDGARAAVEGEALVRKDPWLTRRTVWALDAARLVSQPGPSLVEGIETFAAIMHPALFTAPALSNAIQLKETA
jgi:iron complex transport system substrate-binding protein